MLSLTFHHSLGNTFGNLCCSTKALRRWIVCDLIIPSWIKLLKQQVKTGFLGSVQ